MLRHVEVLGGVPARRLIAAADVAALLTEPEMDPTAADLEAFFAAAGRLGGHLSHFSQVKALL
jgi:hypothetical protein